MQINRMINGIYRTPISGIASGESTKEISVQFEAVLTTSFYRIAPSLILILGCNISLSSCGGPTATVTPEEFDTAEDLKKKSLSEVIERIDWATIYPVLYVLGQAGFLRCPS